MRSNHWGFFFFFFFLVTEIGQWKHSNFTSLPKAIKKTKWLSSSANAESLKDCADKELEMPPLHLKTSKKLDGNWISSVKNDEKYQEWVEIFHQFNPIDGKVEAKFALAGCGWTGDELKK